MNEDLIKKLQEADIFTPVSDEEAAYREANRPPRVLSATDDDNLQITLCTMAMTLTPDEVQDYLYSGTPVFSKPILRMSTAELVENINAFQPAYAGGSNSNLPPKKFVLAMVEEYMGEKYDDIEGVK